MIEDKKKSAAEERMTGPLGVGPNGQLNLVDPLHVRESLASEPQLIIEGEEADDPPDLNEYDYLLTGGGKK